MRRVTAVSLGAAIVWLLSMFAAQSAAASGPAVLLLAGSSFPIVEESTNLTTSTELQSAAGILKGTGYSGSGDITSASAGTFKIAFFNIRKGETRCESEGDPEGTVLFGEDEGQLVYISLSPLQVGVLVTVKEFSFMCGTTKIKKTGTVISTISPMNVESVSFSGGLECSLTVGEPAHTVYWNSSGEEKHALLLVNFGTGFKKACLSGSASGTSSVMIEVMG
jgi:hypothetical protein